MRRGADRPGAFSSVVLVFAASTKVPDAPKRRGNRHVPVLSVLTCPSRTSRPPSWRTRVTSTPARRGSTRPSKTYARTPVRRTLSDTAVATCCTTDADERSSSSAVPG